MELRSSLYPQPRLLASGGRQKYIDTNVQNHITKQATKSTFDSVTPVCASAYMCHMVRLVAYTEKDIQPMYSALAGNSKGI